MSWKYRKGNKIYLEWRYGAMKALQSIARLRESPNRFFYDEDCIYESDKTFVKELISEVKRYFLFLDERDNPIEFK